VFAIDVLACASCGGRLRFLAAIEDRPVVTKILAQDVLTPAVDGRLITAPLERIGRAAS